MINRMRLALCYPVKLLFEKMKWYETTLYFVLLLLISSVPKIIDVTQTIRLDNSDEMIIKDTFKMVDLPYYIGDDYLLHGSSEVVQKNVGINLSVIITTEEDYRKIYSDRKTIIIGHNGVYVSDIGCSKLFSYDEFEELKGLNFIGATNNKDDFWTVIFSITNDVLARDNVLNKIISVFKNMITVAVVYLVFVLLLTLFQGGVVKDSFSFKRRFSIVIYILTPYSIGMLLSELFGVTIFFINGLFITLINNMKLSNSMIKEDNNEL